MSCDIFYGKNELCAMFSSMCMMNTNETKLLQQDVRWKAFLRYCNWGGTHSHSIKGVLYPDPEQYVWVTCLSLCSLYVEVTIMKVDLRCQVFVWGRLHYTD